MGVELFWKVNTEDSVEDKAMGEKHAPVITLPAEMVVGQPVKVRVSIGNGKHPNMNEHFIQWIELRVNGMYISRAEFSPIINQPEVEFTIVCPSGHIEISALVRCNMHGLWEAKKARN